MRHGAALLLALSLLSTGCAFAWRALERNLSAPDPKPVPNKIENPRRDDARLSVLWVGHATALVQIDDAFVLTDPLFENTISQLTPRLVEPGIDVENVPPLAAVLVSHMHFDHLSFPSLAQLEAKTPIVIAPPGVRANMPRFDFETRELGWWTSHTLPNGMRVTAVPVQHVGGRYVVDEPLEREGFTGYVVEYHGLSVYFGGDTAFAPRLFAATRARFPNLDLAIIPICPGKPREVMARTHVDPAEALEAFRLLGAKQMLPIHFDTFINSDDAPGECPAELRRQMQKRGFNDAQVPILAIGEQRVLIAK